MIVRVVTNLTHKMLIFVDKKESIERIFKESELILNDRGAVYHLNLLPDEIADTIITVGDPQRVKKVSQYFDTVDIKRKKREFKLILER